MTGDAAALERPATRTVIRRARPDDLEAIVAMVGRFIEYTQYGTIFRFLPMAVRELTERVITLGVVFLADVDGRTVGMIAGFAMEEPIGRLKMLDELAWWVDPAYRRGTVGPRLLLAFEGWARQKGLRYVKMIAPHAAPEVGRYYEHNGYLPIETSYLKRIS